MALKFGAFLLLNNQAHLQRPKARPRKLRDGLKRSDWLGFFILRSYLIVNELMLVDVPTGVVTLNLAVMRSFVYLFVSESV